MESTYILNKLEKIASRAIALLFFICISLSASGEQLLHPEYSCRRYTTADGLPSLLSGRIHQDKRGFIWIAGTSGLSCFDGFGFKTYLAGSFANLYHIEELNVPGGAGKESAGLIRVYSDRYIYSLYSGSDTLQRTYRFDNYFPTVFSSTTLPAGYAIFYAKGKDDEQYFCSVSDTGIVKLIAHEDLDCLYDHNRAWYEETTHLLYLPLPEGISVVNEKGRVAFQEGINAMCFVNYQNALWTVAIDGLYRQGADGKFEKMFNYDMGDVQSSIVARASSSGLLFTDGYSLYRYDGNRIEKIFESNIIRDFIVDRDDNIWVATYQGVYNLFNLHFKNYRLADETDNVRSLVYDVSKKRVIAGTLNGKLIEITEDSQRELPYPKNPLVGEYNTFTPHGSAVGETIYLPGPGGFLRIEGQQSRWVTFPDEQLFLYLFVTPLPDGNLLTGGSDQLMITTPSGRLLKKIIYSDLKQRIYSKPCLDKEGRIWIGGANGITIVDGDSIKAMLNDSLAYCRVMDTAPDGHLWFASENRLFKAGDEWDVRQVRLFDSQIANICFTQSGLLVVTTLNKVYLFNKDMKDHVFYDHQNGFTGMEILKANLVEDGVGNLWLPAMECLVAFNPDLLMKESGKPYLHLLASSMSVDNLRWKAFDTDARELSYRQKNIRFSYIGLSYSRAQNVRYYYRLRGFQDEWSDPTLQREVTFNNLPPGDYVFEVYADAGTDESRSDIRSIAFSIKPAFWQTLWFFVLCIALLMLASTGIALYIQRRKNKLILEKLRTEKELNELRISSIRLKAIPHFNANVLAAIEYYIANRTKEEAMRILGIYSDYTLKTLSELDKAARPLSDEIAYVKMYLDLEKIRFIDKFDFRIDVDSKVDKEILLPNMILHTYCENAVKHGLMPRKSGGLLSIRISQHDRMVSVSVEDNGVGRAYAASHPYLHSTKQGLSILNRQIEIYNRFNCEKINQYIEDLNGSDGQASGTRFTVEVPLDFMYIN